MCFSAEASFGASGLLAAVAVVAMVKAKTGPQRLFATIPFLFSLQQFSEGMLWLSFKDTGFASTQILYIYSFLFFALIIWPVWIPLSIRLLEKNVRRKKRINILLITGALVSAAVVCILLLYPVRAEADHHHIHYVVGFPPAIKKMMWLFGLLYVVTTIIPAFFSSIKRMKWLGIFFALSYAFAIAFYSGFLISVWCYFAAVLSVVVLWILAGMRKTALQFSSS